MCFTLRLHTSAAPPQGGLTQALGRLLMNIVSQPLFYVAISLAGMFLYVWLLDRAYNIYIPDIDKKPEDTPSVTQAPLSIISALRVIGRLIVTIILWLSLYKTSLKIADLVLLAALLGFTVSSYRIRLRPLLASGFESPRLL